MISLACAALLLTHQQPANQNPQEQARPVPTVAIPNLIAELGGLKFEYKSNKQLGAYIPSPESGDIWKSIETLAKNSTVSKKKIRVQVVLFPETLTIARHLGKYIQDRTILVGPEREAFDNSLKQFELMLRASGFDPTISFDEDNDILVLNDINLAAGTIASILQPQINDQQFQGEDPKYRGPFDVIIAVTSAPMPEIWNMNLDQSLLSVIPISRVSPLMSDFDFAAYLYNSAAWQLKSAKQTNRVQVVTPIIPQAVTPTIDLTLGAELPNLERTPEPEPEILSAESPLHRLPIDTSIYMLADGTIATTGTGSWALRNILSGANPPKISHSGKALDIRGRIWNMYKSNGSSNIVETLGVLAPVTIQGEPSVPETGPINPEYKTFGNFRPTKPLTSLENIPNTFTYFGYQAKGGIEIISRRQIPVIENPEGKVLDYTIATDSQEVLAIMVYGKDDLLLGVYQIGGPKQSQPWTLQRKKFNGSTPVSDSISLANVKQPIYKIVVGVPPAVIPSNKLFSGSPTIEIKQIAIKAGPLATPAVDEAQPFDSFDPNAPNSVLEQQVNGGDAMVSLAALGVLADQPVNAQAAFFGALSRDGSSARAYLAAKALTQLGSPEAMAELKTTVEQGPFDYNRRFAAMAISKPIEGFDYLNLGNLLLTSRSWYTRIQGAKLVSFSQSPTAQTYLVTSLFDTSANVRGSIAKLLDPNFPLSGRRLLFLAVNDVSEDIRATCYVKLLETEDDAVLAEALKGIRDESRLVRLAILARIMATPDEKFRGTFRIAILDKDPIVQALVLKAFSQLPEPVEIGEFSNTIGSIHIPVQLALLQLADSKNIQLPQQELTRLSGSPDKNVSDLAKKLLGGTL